MVVHVDTVLWVHDDFQDGIPVQLRFDLRMPGPGSYLLEGEMVLSGAGLNAERISSPMSSGTTVWVGVYVDVWGFEGAFRGMWEEMASRSIAVRVGLLMVFLAYRHVRFRRMASPWLP